MRVVGQWIPDERGLLLPFVRVQVRSADGERPFTNFQVDTGADRTALCRDTLDALNLPSLPPAAAGLKGVGGPAGGVLVEAVLVLRGEGGAIAAFPGPFAAFLDPAATDYDLLGRDILDQFALIADCPTKQVLLLRHPHTYRVVEAT